jgi:hypothetical protein
MPTTTNDQIKALTEKLYQSRKTRASHPDGKFDSAQRWYPSEIEDAGGEIIRTHRSPSRAWPFSYMLACRAKKHCKVLVERALAGHAVPSDCERIVRT